MTRATIARKLVQLLERRFYTMTLDAILSKGHNGVGELQQNVKSMAIKLGIDDHLRRLRSALHPAYRREGIDNRSLRLLLTFALKENSNCIDVGAYRGAVLAEIVRVAPYGRHIAYEPSPCMHKRLVECFPTVDVRRAAVSNEAGERSFAFLKHMPAHSGFSERLNAKRSRVEKITVRTEALDGSLPAGYRPDLIKIDVEGAERLVIEGALETISKYKPIVVFEHGKGGADYYDTQPRQIYGLLHDEARLCIFDLDGEGPYSLGQFEETYERNDRWNFVARP
jgi:FkbM family methyltransferase